MGKDVLPQTTTEDIPMLTPEEMTELELNCQQADADEIVQYLEEHVSHDGSPVTSS